MGLNGLAWPIAFYCLTFLSASRQLLVTAKSDKGSSLRSSGRFQKDGALQSSNEHSELLRVLPRVPQGSYDMSSQTVRPTVLYLSFHQGTAMDLGYVFQQLKVAHRWIIPKHLPYLVTREVAQDDWDKYGEYQCGIFDFIIFGDTVPRARALLEHNCTDSQIILQVTQRFDAGMEGKEGTEWIDILRKAAAEMPNVHMVINNPYEQWYMKHVRNADFFRPILIRPSGHWPDTIVGISQAQGSAEGSISSTSATRSAIAVVVQEYIPYLNDILLGNLTMMGMSYAKLPHGRYGGANALAHYSCVIQLPYQVSVMAMYENLAAGVALVVPSLSFYRAMAPNLVANGVGLHLVDLPILEKEPSGWEAMEWFSPYFKNALLHFDSWEHLAELLERQSFVEHKRALKSFMEVHSTEVLRKWDSLLRHDSYPGVKFT